jgi:hypothetical protein
MEVKRLSFFVFELIDIVNVNTPIKRARHNILDVRVILNLGYPGLVALP